MILFGLYQLLDSYKATKDSISNVTVIIIVIDTNNYFVFQTKTK